MHEFAFEVPDKVWSTNQDRNLNPYARAERILAWKTATQLGWASYCNRRGTTRKLEPSLVRVSIPFKQRRRRDPHNYCGTVVKAILDGLVLAGAWSDDTPEYVEHLAPSLPVGGPQFVKISIWQKGPARFACQHGSYFGCTVDDSCKGGWEVSL
jgi:hypothetical protein